MIIWVNGGFSVRFDGVRLRARDPLRPLLAALALLVGYGWWSHRERSFARDLLWFDERLDRLAPALALAVAAALAAVGIGWGSYVASGSDSYGYLSQADRWAQGAIVQPEPLASRFAWKHVDGIFSPIGYRPGLVPHTTVPIYSPGLPLLMAGAKIVAGACGPHLVVPLCAFALVWLTFALGRRVLSQRAALAAALLVATSPIVVYQTVLPMSDVPVAAAWTLALVLLVRARTMPLVASGVAAGVAILIRPNLAPLAAVPVGALLLAHTVPIQTRLQRVAVFVPGVLAAASFIAILNNQLYGSPFRSGYDALPDLFSWSNVAFNASRYAERFAITATPAILVAVVPLFGVAFRRVERVSMRLLLYGTIAVMLALYLPYERFHEWWYLRFLLPAYPPLYVGFCGGATWALSKLPRHVAFAIGALGVAALVWFAVARSATWGVLGMQRYEGRYAAVGQWIDEHLPDNAVVLSKQHSGSVRYHGARLTLRYDRIEDLRGVIGDLVRAGYHPYLLLEDWERPEFTNRFLGVGFERLSWQPLARMRQPEPLALYDLLNRASEMMPAEIPGVGPACGPRAPLSTR